MSKPITVKCDYCLKEYSSSTILFHQKKHHLDLPFQYTPSEISCSKCFQTVLISNLHTHNVVCDKRPQKKSSLGTILEELDEEFRSVCKFCKRKFAIGRIEKHQAACELSSKKRPQFDMLKKRVPSICETYQKINTKRASVNLIYPNSKWQKQHLELLRNLRYGNDESIYEDYIQCPHCFRKFAPNNAEKHIDICKNIVHKPRPVAPVLNRFPNIKKIEKLSIRTNSTNTLWRPASVYCRDICDKNSTNHRSSSFYDSENNENNLVDIALSPIKTPFLKKELLDTPAIKSIKNEYLTVNCPNCGKKFIENIAEKHIKLCKRQTLKSSATHQNLVKKNDTFKLEKDLPKKKLKYYTGRSHSTQRLNDGIDACALCGAIFPKKAKFCMMCGTLRNN